MAMMQLEEVWK